MAAASGQAQSVLVRSGNIIYRSDQGHEYEVTSLGKDYDPSLSHDGTLIVFARQSRAHVDASGNGMVVDESQVCLVNVTHPGRPLHVVAERPMQDGTTPLGWIASPKLSPDNGTIYFLVPNYAAVSGGLFEVKVGTADARFITKALKFWVVPSGEYKGQLIVWQNPMLLIAGRYDVFNMIKDSGDVVGIIGFTQDAVTGYLASEAALEAIEKNRGK
jgi:hypothetical protein